MAPSVKENIVFGGEVASSITAPFRSLGHFLLDRYHLYGDNVMMINAASGHQYKRKDIYERVVRLAYILKHLGIKQGDVVGLCAENSIDYAVTIFATLAVGATAAPFNVTYSDRELNHGVNLSKPKVVFCSSSSLSKILTVAHSNKFIQRVVVFGEQSSSPHVATLSQLVSDKTIVSYPDFESPEADKVNDVALIVCSSGTTGQPKGVQLTHLNIMSILDQQSDPTQLQLSGVAILSVIPWFHSFGCLTLIGTSCKDNTLVFLPKFEDKVFLGAIEKYKVVMAYMVPPLMVFLAKHPMVEKYDLSSLLVLACGAAPLRKETEDVIMKRIGVPMIRQGYGMSETTLSTLIQTNTHCKPGSVGTVKPGVWAKVVDTETGVVLGPNERGELCFKGPSIMKGYIGDVASTAAMIKDGWLHTGDIGYFDDEFVFYIVDRIKELIKYKAFQVPPAEIEAILLTHPKIKDAAVIGKPDESAGELPMAFVVKQEMANITAEEVITFVGENVSPAKKLRGGVVFIDEIPKNQSGKILRRVLRDILKQPKSKL